MTVLKTGCLMIATFFYAQFPLLGQEARGTILGHEIDQSGGVISGAKVEASNIGTFFFFQAEDGIRGATVTGVQTCALPIYHRRARLIRPSPTPSRTLG